LRQWQGLNLDWGSEKFSEEVPGDEALWRGAKLTGEGLRIKRVVSDRKSSENKSSLAGVLSRGLGLWTNKHEEQRQEQSQAGAYHMRFENVDFIIIQV
jgi:hypothetical protein